MAGNNKKKAVVRKKKVKRNVAKGGLNLMRCWHTLANIK